MNPPEVQVLSGSPTDAETHAIAQAFIALWRDNAAKAKPQQSGWVRAARQEMSQPGLRLARRVGRGDQR